MVNDSIPDAPFKNCIVLTETLCDCVFTSAILTMNARIMTFVSS